MYIRPAQESDCPAWLEMQLTLWPDEDIQPEEWTQHQQTLLERGHAFIALEPSSESNRFDSRSREGEVYLGFAEVGLRPYAEGCKSSPVAFLEGWFVKESARGKGIGRALIEHVERWGLEQGCTELASDTLLEWVDSQQAHSKVGFEEVERLVVFRKSLEP